MQRIFTYIITVLLCFTLASCDDDFGRDYGNIPEGSTKMTFELSYPQFEAAAVGRATGNAHNVIRNVWVVAYQTDGDGYKYVSRHNCTEFTENDNTRAKFGLVLKNGYYKLYAVVNYDLSKVTDDQIDTIDKLKALELEWDEDNVENNAEMFGYFINGTADSEYPSEDKAVVTVHPDKPTNLYAKVRRAASKVTIAFNTTQLKENIFIYLKSVSIVDAPKHCPLSNPNELKKEDFTRRQTIYFKGAEEGHTGINDYQKWPMISRGDGIFGLYSDEKGRVYEGEINDRRKREHSADARALFFYENIQEDGNPGTESDKKQVVTGKDPSLPSYPEGYKPDNPAWKDARPYGTYIEVQAYYENINTDHPSKGDIIYRFMLGKDTETNFEAERNHHYQVTMAFLGNANEIDFHIEYREEAKPGIYAPDVMMPYYYNQESTSTLRVTPKPGYKMTSVEAYIVNNEWKPEKLSSEDEIKRLYNTNAWDMQQEYSHSYDYDIPKEYREVDKKWAKNCEFGFLSLHKSDVTTVVTGAGSSSTTLSLEKLRERYYSAELKNAKTGETKTGVRLGKRIFNVGIPEPNKDIKTETLTTQDAVSGDYTITRTNYTIDGDFEYICQFPVFTRARTIGTWEVYTGANPYHTNSRWARLLYVVNYESTDGSGAKYTETTSCNLYQTHRLDNPRGIFRRHGNLEPFKVTLMRQDGDLLTRGFSPVTSRGPWSATIELDPHGIVSLSANGKTVTGQGKKIMGETNSIVTFTYKPIKDTPSEKESYGALIVVRYHNESCTHHILVRQGYGLTKLSDNSPWWSTFNVHDYQNFTVNPLSIGALFRRFSGLRYPILENNEGDFGFGKDPGKNAKYKMGAPIKNETKKELTWDEIEVYTTSNTESATSIGKKDAFTGMQFKNSEGGLTDYRLPWVNELPGMSISIDGKDPQLMDVHYGFGIVYADGATTTLATPDAYSFTDPDNNTPKSEKGARGVVAYNIKTGANLFFPFGMTGHARRKSTHLDPIADKTTISTIVYGLMRYSSIDTRLDKRTFDNYRPLAWDLPNQQGGIYWINNNGGTQTANGGKNIPVAIDFNSGNYMVSYLNSSDLVQNNKFDACPVKPVLK